MYIVGFLLALCGGEEVTINASAFAKGDVDVNACHVRLCFVAEIKKSFYNFVKGIGQSHQDVFIFSLFI